MEFSFHIPNVHKPMNMKQRIINQETSSVIRSSSSSVFKKSTSLRSGSVKLNLERTPVNANDSSSRLDLNAFNIKIASPSNKQLEEVQFTYSSMKAIAENIEMSKDKELNKDKAVTPKASLKIEQNALNSKMSFGIAQSEDQFPNKDNENSFENFPLERMATGPQK